MHVISQSFLAYLLPASSSLGGIRDDCCVPGLSQIHFSARNQIGRRVAPTGYFPPPHASKLLFYCVRKDSLPKSSVAMNFTSGADVSELLSLDRIRNQLIRLEDTIIFCARGPHISDLELV